MSTAAWVGDLLVIAAYAIVAFTIAVVLTRRQLLG